MAVICCLAPAALAEDLISFEDSYVQLKIKGGFTPYSVINYDVFWRKKVAIAGHYRSLVNYHDSLHRMRLISDDEYLDLFAKLRAAGGWDLKDAPVPAFSAGGLHCQVTLKYAGRKVSFKVVTPDAQDDPRYAAVVNIIRDFVLKYAGNIPFRNIFFEPGTFGYVNLTSVPNAKVWVDGQDIRLETPIYGYELLQGPHEVKLETRDGRQRVHTLRVEPGMTTVIHFDLR